MTVLMLAACAKQGMPTGGPKDTEPPRVVRTTPANSTLNFAANEFYIEFDEYVTIKDAENNVIVSPPLRNRAEYKTRGRGVAVRLHDTLQANTTYLFQFKDAIADFNEGNLLPSLEYVFSTGNDIDSMTLGGEVLDLLTQKALEDRTSVWLYRDEGYATLLGACTDTAITAPKPDYVTICDKNGLFAFNHIQPGSYHIVAIVDENKDMKVEPEEAVAFLPSTVTATNPPKTDTTAKPEETGEPGKTILHVFTPERQERQRITSSDFTEAGKVRITTLTPMLRPSIDAGGEKFVTKLNSKGDTLTLWTLRKTCDSVQLVIIDSSGLNDTLRLHWRAKKGMKGLPSLTSNSLEMKPSHRTLPHFDTLRLLFGTPLDTAYADTSIALTFRRLKDSTVFQAFATVDSCRMQATVNYTFAQEEKYDIDIAKDTFKDIYGRGNDSLHAVVTLTKEEDFGNLRLTLTYEGDAPLIVELTDEKGKVLETRKNQQAGTVSFRHLKPAKYKIRVVVDQNRNGRWDAGDFASQRLSEPVIHFKKTLDIRANWDFDEKMDIP